jgi:hypothetical protein
VLEWDSLGALRVNRKPVRPTPRDVPSPLLWFSCDRVWEPELW